MKIVECPRDAMQGIHQFIPTELKAEYINQLLKVGFDTIDFGSFVSPKAIPQMQDTAQVLEKLDLSASKSKLLAIIANVRGAEEASRFQEIHYLGFPFSISETFQQRNTNSSIQESFKTVSEIQEKCVNSGKELVVYISMAFGNPYGDEYNAQIAIDCCGKLVEMGIKTLALSDTIGISNAGNIKEIFSKAMATFPEVEFGAHLHSRKESALEKIKAAYENKCRRFDVAIHGFGGCPMAKDELTGNLATEDLISFFESERIPHQLNSAALFSAYEKSWEIFNHYH
jgi:hydroxymethylglutaryl-CoA lyase